MQSLKRFVMRAGIALAVALPCAVLATPPGMGAGPRLAQAERPDLSGLQRQGLGLRLRRALGRL